MYAIEFEAPIKNGVIVIPEKFSNLKENSNAKVIVLIDKAEETQKPLFDEFLSMTENVESVKSFNREQLHNFI